MTPRTIFIIAILAIISTITLIVRALPMLLLGDGDPLNIVSMDDPLYNLRLIEWVLAHGFAFPSFDAMSFAPYGQIVPWGPMFTWMAALFPLVAGAATRQEIISASLWAPPVIAALTVPITYLIAQKIWDWKAGLFAAMFLAVVGGQFFFRSFAGYLDHHVAEVFFGAVFALLYTYAIYEARNEKKEIDPVYVQICKNKETSPLYWGLAKTGSTPYKASLKPHLLAALAGLAYVLGFLNMPTMVLFAIIAMITTTVISIMDFSDREPTDSPSPYLVVVNAIVFGIAAVVSLLAVRMIPLMGLSGYTIFHPFTYLIVIAWSLVLYLLAMRKQGNTTLWYVVSILEVVAVVALALALVIPGIAKTFITAMVSFFGFNQIATTIQEARPWTVAEAWSVYNFGMVLMAGGFIILLAKTFIERRIENVFVLVWSVFIIISTFRQVRYEYYLAINIALLSGVCLAFFLGKAWPHIISFRRKKSGVAPAPTKGKQRKGQNRPLPSAKKSGGPDIIAAAVVLMFAVAFIGTSASTELSVVTSGSLRMNQDWRSTMEWMKANTPDPGVDYMGDYQEEGFAYPPGAYGVMSWWDYGHMITYLANRIPTANPFQNGVAGPYGSARFFMTSDERDAMRIADAMRVRYVVTDMEMATGKFWAMATWYNSTAAAGPYTHAYLTPTGNDGAYIQALIYTGDYSQTVIARLHAFDGSFVQASPNVIYLEYRTVDGMAYPVVANAKEMSPADAIAAADRFNQNAASLGTGTGADVGSPVFVVPVADVPALNNFRLVYESPTNIFSGGADCRYVKVFEYVPGARVPGEGMIETGVKTNTGRQFTWRAASEDGVFVVPYAGTYTILGTGASVIVPEEAVVQGGTV